jgi:metallo-beta-lactamase family protein
MNITVYGAACEVTGSCYLVDGESEQLLVDCGLFQGSEKLERLNYLPRGINARALSAVILTHGHLDHCGRLPLLAAAGFKGPIYCTEPTAQIAHLVMMDSAKIQEEDTMRANRQRAQEGLPAIKPLYSTEDVEKAARLFKPVPYNTAISVGRFKFKLVEAGHILGSACVELTLVKAEGQTEVVFSGDVGQWNVPILEDPASITDSPDMVFMESTYGLRDHRALNDTIKEFREAICQTVAAKGKVLIPTFAVGRAQLILFYLAQMFHEKLIADVPVYLDSPMAVAATEIYTKYIQFMDDESRQLSKAGEFKEDLKTLHNSLTPEESRALNAVEGPCIILAGSGMCNAGRILHHLRHNLSSPENLVLIVGYQPKGSLGNLLVNGAKTVKIFHETVPVRATTRGLGGFSAHAGQHDLLRWLAPMVSNGKKTQVVLVHGEGQSMDQISFLIKEQFGIEAKKPKLGDKLTV